MVGNKKQLQRWLIDLTDEEKLYEIKEHRQKRSLSANAYFHVLCERIGESITPRLSHTEVHNWLISDYGQVDKDVRTIILRDDIDWRRLDTIHLRPTTATRVLDDQKLYRVYHVMRGSHTYDSREMGKLIDGAIQEAQALDIETTTVSERDRMIEEWGRQYERKHNSAKRQEVLHMWGMEPDGQAPLPVRDGE